MKSISGTVEKVMFRNEDTGFSVVRLITEPGKLVTIAGVCPIIIPGQFVDCEGEWNTTKRFGKQLNASVIRCGLPRTTEAVAKYLASGRLNSIGQRMAKKLAREFGPEVFEILDSGAEQLLSVPGFSRHRLRKVLDSWQTLRLTEKSFSFLQSNGLTSLDTQRIVNRFGGETIRKVSENPYRLLSEIDSIDFRVVDELGRCLGVDATSELRIRAAIVFLLKEYSSQGHSAYPFDSLLNDLERLLGISRHAIHAELERAESEGSVRREICSGGVLIYLESLWSAEVEVATHIKRLLSDSSDWAKRAEIALHSQESDQLLSLSTSQKEALALSITHKVIVITGGPGVGKTTVVREIISLAERSGARAILCAPTGRAAKRLSESTSKNASTIHRMLEYDAERKDFVRDTNNPLDADLVVVDEVSMIDISLMQKLLRAIANKTHLILVGDIDQLPSIGPGSVLSDLISSEVLPVVRLTEIFRQSERSEIVLNAHKINRGELPDLEWSRDKLSDFYFVSADSANDIVKIILRITCERIPERFSIDPMNVQVLSPMNKGDLGTHVLNKTLQEKLNKAQNTKIQLSGHSFSSGDKVMQLTNDYDKLVYNGDIGTISGINGRTQEVSVQFDGREVYYQFTDLTQLALAYAISIHKAQGSEYPAVVMPVSMLHAGMLERNLLYTAITRARRVVVLVGELKALKLAVEKRFVNRRFSGLSARLRDVKRQFDTDVFNASYL